MNEIDAVVQVLDTKCTKILNSRKLTDNQKKGDIGEIFVKYGVKQCLWDRGFKVAKRGNNSFIIPKQFKGKRKGMGGVDFFLNFIDSNSKTFGLFIEVKNWKHFIKGITPTMFNEKILDRYQRYDPSRKYIWVVVINKRNRKYITQNCKNNKIHIITLDQHLTPQTINQLNLRSIFDLFMNDFTVFLDDVLNGKITP